MERNTHNGFHCRVECKGLSALMADTGRLYCTHAHTHRLTAMEMEHLIAAGTR